MKAVLKVLVAGGTVLVLLGSLCAGLSGDEALRELLDGNLRFVSGKIVSKDIGEAKRKDLTRGQHPSAVVLTCSDSRVPPEYVFDQGLGNLFVVRTAGNTVDKIAIGSIEYGVEYLHAPLFVILGHQHCGAVKAAIETFEKGQKSGGNKGHDSIGEIINKIMPAVKKANASGNRGNILEIAIQENARNVYDEILANSPVINELVQSGKIKVVVAEYYLDSGRVKILRK